MFLETSLFKHSCFLQQCSEKENSSIVSELTHSSLLQYNCRVYFNECFPGMTIIFLICTELRKSMNGIYVYHSEHIFNGMVLITDYKHLLKD